MGPFTGISAGVPGSERYSTYVITILIYVIHQQLQVMLDCIDILIDGSPFDIAAQLSQILESVHAEFPLQFVAELPQGIKLWDGFR